MLKAVVFNLTNSEYVELCSLLKVTGPNVTGGEAKQLIMSGAVQVDRVVETRKKCKIRAGQSVIVDGFVIRVVL